MDNDQEDMPIRTRADARAYIDAVMAQSNRFYTPTLGRIQATLVGANEHTWRSIEMALADALFMWKENGNSEAPYAKRVESVWLELFGDPTSPVDIEQQRAELAGHRGSVSL